MAISRTLVAYVLLLSIVLLSCSDLYNCKRDMSDAHIEAATAKARAISRNLGTVDASRCYVRYIIGEKMYCCPNGCWDQLPDCQKACKP
ncbi:hypothetical protein AgCh_009874 [Apium graveolens]